MSRFKHLALRSLSVIGAHKTVLRLQDHEAEIGLLPYLVDQDRTAIDIGAADGGYALYLSSLAKHCVAIEPNPVKCMRLKKMLPRVRVIQMAASSSKGEAVLRVPIVNGIKYQGWATMHDGNKLNELP